VTGFIHPNPCHPGRSILVITGNHPGGFQLPLDNMPVEAEADYIIREQKNSETRILKAGFF